MLKKVIAIFLNIVLLLTYFPVYAFGTDVVQYIPLYNEMDSTSGITGIDSGYFSLTQDRVSGNYAVKASYGDIPNVNEASFKLAGSQPFDSVKYSQIRLWVKPSTGSSWIKFMTGSSVLIKNDKNGDGIFAVGEDLVSGKWNEVTLDLTKTSVPITTAQNLLVSTNENSTWLFDKITTDFNSVLQINPQQLVNSNVRYANNQLQFIPSSNNLFNILPTVLTSKNSYELNQVDTSQTDFSQGTLSSVSVNTDGSLQLNKEYTNMSVAAGSSFSMGLKADGTVWGWGYGAAGRLGDGTNTTAINPVRTQGLNNIIQIETGEVYTIALKSDGTVWSWGNNNYGQLGDGTTTIRTTPVQVSGLSNVKAIYAGRYHNFAIKNDGTVWAWGRNNYGQLGDNTTTDQKIPVQIPGLTNVIAMDVGTSFSIALKSDGTVWGWGNNNSGQLGDGTTFRRPNPVQTANLSNVIKIACGDGTSLALKSDGTVWGWGYNSYGTIGDGSETDRTRPVLSSINDVKDVFLGDTTSMAIKNDGTLWSWGRNDYGQLGIGPSAGEILSPVIVPGINPLKVSISDRHSVALIPDGRVMAWGNNTYYQLGDGTTVDKKSPVTSNILLNRYSPSGYRENTLDLSKLKSALSSKISWNDNIPANTGLVVETNLSTDGGASWKGWKTATKNGQIPDITANLDLRNARLKYRTTLTTSDIGSTPTLYDISVTVQGGDPPGVATLQFNKRISSIYIDSGYVNATGASIALPNMRLLVPGIQPRILAVSGDGNKVYYGNPSDGDKLYLFNLLTGENKKVSDYIPIKIKVNEDGKKAVFSRLYNGSSYLYVYDEDTAAVTSIYTASGGDAIVSFDIQNNGTIYYLTKTSPYSISKYINGSTSNVWFGNDYNITRLAVPKTGDRIFCVMKPSGNDSQLYSLTNTSGLWEPYSLRTTALDIMSNADGSLIYFPGSKEVFQVSTKAARKIEVKGTALGFVGTDKIVSQLAIGSNTNPPYLYKLYDINTDTEVDIKPGDARNPETNTESGITDVLFSVNNDGSRMVYVSVGTNTGLSTYYINGAQRPERYLFSFDGKNSWHTYKDGVWRVVKTGGVPTENEFISYGMTIEQVNAMGAEDYESLYADGREITQFDVSMFFTSNDPTVSPALKGIRVALVNTGEAGGAIYEKSLYVTKEQSFNSKSWRKIKKINPVQIFPGEADARYFVFAGSKYKTYKNKQWSDIDASLLANVENNWIKLTQLGMTADELRVISADALSSLLPQENLKVVYALKVEDMSTEGYSSLINIESVDNLFDAPMTLHINFMDGTTKTYAGLGKKDVEEFMEWVNGRQANKGSYFYTIKTIQNGIEINDFINFYSIKSISVDDSVSL